MATVLIVDDTMLARRILKNILCEAGHEIVAEAGNGAEAVEAFREHRPDVVLMDITMPQLDGVHASRQILSEFPEARVVMVTSVNREATVRESLHAGAAGYIIKPYKADTVVDTLMRVLAAVPAATGAPSES